MKICLVNPPVNQHYAPLDIPLQLLILATISRDTGWRPHIIDFNLLTKYNPHFPLSDKFFKPAIEHIHSYNPDIIGITCLSSTIPFAIEIARKYKKEYPSCQILLGGPQATLLHDKILERFPFIDIVCRGEGEVTLKEILKNCNDLGMIPGISYRNSSGKTFINPNREMMKNLDQVTIPDYDLLNLAEYKKNVPGISLHIEAGRGCPYACSYCSTSLVWGRKFRLKSLSAILTEIEQTIDKTGITNIHFIHDLFSLNNNWVSQLCEALLEMETKITWGCDTRVDAVTPGLLKKMAGCGCKSIFFGVESGSKRIQKEMKKHIDLDQAIAIISESIACNISITTSFILGYPSETLDELNDTFEYILLFLTLKVTGIVVNTFMPEYGTESYFLCTDRLETNPYMIQKDLPFVNKEIIQLISGDPEIFSHFYYPRQQNYDFNILIKLLTVLSTISFISVLKNIQFYVPMRNPIDIFIEFYDFIKDAIRLDEYHNVRFNASGVYKGMVSFLRYLNKKYDIVIDERSADKDRIEHMTRILNNFHTARGFNVKREIDKDK